MVYGWCGYSSWQSVRKRAWRRLKENEMAGQAMEQRKGRGLVLTKERATEGQYTVHYRTEEIQGRVVRKKLGVK